MLWRLHGLGVWKQRWGQGSGNYTLGGKLTEASAVGVVLVAVLLVADSCLSLFDPSRCKHKIYKYSGPPVRS